MARGAGRDPDCWPHSQSHSQPVPLSWALHAPEGSEPSSPPARTTVRAATPPRKKGCGTGRPLNQESGGPGSSEHCKPRGRLRAAGRRRRGRCGKAPNLIRCPRWTCCPWLLRAGRYGGGSSRCPSIPRPRTPLAPPAGPSLFCLPADPPPCPWSLPTAGPGGSGRTNGHMNDSKIHPGLFGS